MAADDMDRGRTQVTLRIERDLLDRIDDLAAARHMDRTELARRLLSDGVSRERLDDAVAAYGDGGMSMWMAAAAADVSVYEMIDRVAEAGVPYRIDPEAIDRLRERAAPPSDDGGRGAGGTGATRSADVSPDIEARRAAGRPDRVRLLLVGESSPAGGTHFYLANSNLYRAIREGLAQGLSISQAPAGDDFLTWFRDLGCWLVDMADRPVNRLPAYGRRQLVSAGIPRLTATLRDTRPERVIVVVSSIAGAVRDAAEAAGFDDRRIDVLPFPTRQWRSLFIDQLAAIAADSLPSTAPRNRAGQTEVRPMGRDPVIEHLHDAIVAVLRRHPGGWVRKRAIAKEIADSDLWRRPSDGAHPPSNQISARVAKHPELFQVSDLGVRLRS